MRLIKRGAMSNGFKQPVWVVPLVIAGLVAVFGWWADLRLRHTVEQQVKAELTGTLDANVTALEIWMTNQTKLATSLADEGRVRALASTILQKSYDPAVARDAANAAEAEEFGNYLRPRLAGVGYQIAELVNTNFVMVANSRRAGFNRQVPESHTNQFAELFASGQPVIITPHKPQFPRGFPSRGGRVGQTQTKRVSPP